MESDACYRIAVGLQGMSRRSPGQPARRILVLAQEGGWGCRVELALEAGIALFQI